ncbi:MAG TPA: arylsulfotransferase family protein [Gaiellaceae bacterium]|nr:arylsulfotransferase family protein [Gaiellaceae bacterium]
MRAILPLLLAAVLLAGCSSSPSDDTAHQGKTATLLTLPGASPPILHVDTPATGTAPGYVFLAEKGTGADPSGVVIADNQGRILWYHQVPAGLEATDFRTQTLDGKPVLTWWQGTVSKAGIGKGEDEIYDASYHHIATIRAANGLEADLHEFQLTPRGTAFLTVYNPVPADLTSVGGPKDGWVQDSVVQEIDVATGKLLFEWHSVGHVPFSDSMEANNPPAENASEKAPLDYFHVNSIADGPNGTILISARNTSTIYLLRRDGSIVWRLGGKRSQFGPKAAVTFYYQHNARLHPDGTLSLFDNGGIPRAEPHTRPLLLKVDQRTKRVAILKTFVSPEKIASPYEGDTQMLPDGGAFVGWGGVRKLTEFTPDGQVRFQVTLPYGDTYRGYRLEWDGSPGGRPAAVVRDGIVYASWNGKLGVARWQLLRGSRVVASVPWAGLETAIHVDDLPKHVVVRAVDAAGNPLGESAPAGS